MIFSSQNTWLRAQGVGGYSKAEFCGLVSFFLDLMPWECDCDYCDGRIKYGNKTGKSKAKALSGLVLRWKKSPTTRLALGVYYFRLFSFCVPFRSKFGSGDEMRLERNRDIYIRVCVFVSGSVYWRVYQSKAKSPYIPPWLNLLVREIALTSLNYHHV